MAIQQATFISGKLYNAVFYQRSGTWVVRSVPARVRQSSNTKKRNQNFGVAATVGRLLRQQLGNGIPFPKDKKMQSRFSGAIIKWLGRADVQQLPAQTNLPYLSGFSFNPAANFSSRFKLTMEITRPGNTALQLHLPAFIPDQAFSVPAGTAAVELLVTAAGVNLLQTTAAANRVNTVLQVEYNDTPVAAQTIALPLNSAAGDLLVTVVSMRCLDAKGQVIGKAGFMASAVVDARYV